MTTEAFSGVGTLLYRQPPAGGAYATIGEVLDIPGPNLSRNVADATPLDTDFGEYISAGRDGGELNLSMNMTNDAYDTLLSDYNNDSPANYKIVLPDDDSSMFAFAGFITALSLNVVRAEAVKVSVGIKVSGEVLFYAGSSTTTT